MEKFSVAIIGGGAAGITAAISARRSGKPVAICEKMPQLGKKILITGNGRCNLLNDDTSSAHYNPASRNLVSSVFSRFGKADIVDFFNGLGLEIYCKEGRVFPMTNQASSVLKALEIELKRLSIPVELNFDVKAISGSKGAFILKSKNGAEMVSENIIITGGGKTYPALGSDGNAYELAKKVGHSVIAPVPSAVPLVLKDPLCHLLQGQKIFADVTSLIDGKAAGKASGELLFTKYGLSGTAILDVSEDISIAVNRHHSNDVVISADMVPFMDAKELENELERRIKAGFAPGDFLAGLLPNKFSAALSDLLRYDTAQMAAILKDKRFKVTGTRGWNEAEFTSGGVSAAEINAHTLESDMEKGVYFAGEILDVQGKRGGHNLAWAWASGFVAGLTGSN
ncbi:MAG: aminoacetone oxidase family FAD-binding enzyme [Candidatus Omnitrophica bacterium]|nr:aminoacetone oxidase family FAD-binding enzyme [Candidatus Omnitrophota bacterium]